jgi:hypothetical protein
VIRISREESIPQHCEVVPLKAGVHSLGWLAALGSIASGFAVAAWAPGRLGEIPGSILVILGGVALGAMVGCRRLEVVAGSTRIDLGAGPFHTVVPSGAVESAERRPATGWRRLFADEEILLRVSVGSGEVAIPTRQPSDLLAAIDPNRASP